MKKIYKMIVLFILLIFIAISPGQLKAATIHEVSGSNAIIDSYYSFAPKFTPGCPGRSSMAVEVMIPVLYFVTKVLLVGDYQRTVTSHCYPVML